MEDTTDETPYECHSNKELNQTTFPSNYIRTTKYTLLLFLPKNLWEQFHKVSNIYFAINMIIACLPGVSPIFPVTSILPLVFVLTVAAVKDAVEDYARYREDKKANGTPVTQVVGGKEVADVRADALQVGDFVKVPRDHGFPADLLVIHTPLEDGRCYIETANLDGETNIKPRASPACTTHFNTPHALSRANIKISCDQPNEKLDKWKGIITCPGPNGEQLQRPLVLDNMVFRGCVLKNTPYIYGMVIYAGVDTKMFRNLKRKAAKYSRLDLKLNKLIIGLLVIQQIVIAFLALGSILFIKSAESSPFLRHVAKEYPSGIQYLMNYLTFFVLLSFMMPISLFVSMELCKGFQAKFMDVDEKMMNGNKRMKAKTSNLNDELAMITYVFTDKTGTLTQNEMRFHSCAVLGFPHNEIKDPGGIKRHLMVDGRYHEAIYAFMEVLTLCHTCVISTDSTSTQSIMYEGQSTDEVALVTAAKNNGFVFTSRTGTSVELQWLDTQRSYEVLAVLPFSSDRKRMSTIVRNYAGEIWMLMKGADSKVMPLTRRQTPEDLKWHNHIMQELDKMAKEGLRTLACAHKQLAEEEYQSWKATWDQANLALQNQEALIAQACDMIEKDLVLLGCTGVEDRLQDAVPETIHFLLEAGLVIWVLTGDKRETAVNIATSSRLVDSQNDVIHHLEASTQDDLQSQLFDVLGKTSEEQARGRKVTIVIDGETLDIAMKHFLEQFKQLAQVVSSAVCCRVTPLQKSEVVSLFQGKALGQTALAIGDGANDVSMIQSARVGIGIMGVEGSQAELASDYAIPRFRHLKRLVVTHGRFCFVRNSILIQYSFYKNLVLSLVQIYFAFYNGFTGQTLFDSWVMQMYNIIFTSLPPLLLGIFEKDLPDDIVERNPKLFTPLPKGENFNLITMAVWGCSAIVHSILIFFMVSYKFPVDDIARWRTSGIWTQGSLALTVIISVVLGKIAIHTRHWTIVTVVGLSVSYVCYFVFILIYNVFPIFFGNANYYNVANTLMGDFKFYCWVLFFLFGVLGMDWTLILVQRSRHPSYRYAVAEINKKKDMTNAQRAAEEAKARETESNYGQITLEETTEIPTPYRHEIVSGDVPAMPPSPPAHLQVEKEKPGSARSSNLLQPITPGTEVTTILSISDESNNSA
eukprot:TRINITY_DN84196_c0_g1_i1.p1 TRINITY_DN84196_c0_g1~~TRINITY_DN84196_c0_g1_i1.p1  ORF type:complete len:1149 (-),score=116.15 TRINITY_DN84196_c0_g1_i1:64-3510(-)